MCRCVGFPEKIMNEVGIEMEGVRDCLRFIGLSETKQVKGKYSERSGKQWN
jgi:hypothetical protein